MDNKPKKRKVWHTQQEKILKVWGEQSACYRFMHFKSYQKYQKLSLRFTLPIIIISTITGTANFAQDTFPVTWRPFVPSGIGAFNLVAAIMTTILQFLKINELMESHRVSSIHYGKLSRSVRLQLTLPRDERAQDGAVFIEYCNQEYDRLIEQSPSIPGEIIKLFEKEFPLKKNKKIKTGDEPRTFCFDFKQYCCTSFTEEIDEKDLAIERPEIIKLTPIKPFGFHDGTTKSDASQTTSLLTDPTGPIRHRFKTQPPLPPTPSLTPPEGYTPDTHPASPSVPSNFSEITNLFEERSKKTLPTTKRIHTSVTMPPEPEEVVVVAPTPSPDTLDESDLIASEEVVLNVEELRQKFNQSDS